MSRTHRHSATLLATFLVTSSLTVWAVPAHADESVLGQDGGSLILVLDGSGSMKERSGGQTRMQAAQEGLRGVVRDLPDNSEVGLRVYGARIADGAGSCTDSTLLVPVGAVDRGKLTAGIDRLKPLGNTPIAHSLEQAYKDLPKDGKRSIVLVSDGEENCGGDPCEVARDLKEKGADFYVDVVGLQVDAASRDQLTCVASAGGGTYYDVSDLKNLDDTLRRTSVRAARGYSEAGKPVEGSTEASEKATALRDGQWLDTIGDSGVEYYTVPDPGKGTLHVSASTRTTSAGLSDLEALKIAVTSADGTACGLPARTSVQGYVNQKAPYTAELRLDPKTRESCGEGPYVFSVEPPEVDGVKPLELVVRSEAAVQNSDSLPPAVTSAGFSDKTQAETEPSGAPQSALGSPSFAGAPPVGPGIYQDSILPGETLMYRVPKVEWGQTPVCDFTLQPAGDASKALKDAGYFQTTSARLYSPMKTEITDHQAGSNSSKYSGDAAVSLHVAGPTVRWANRTSSTSELESASLDGDYYCAVTLFTSTPSTDAKAGAVPVTLAVAVNGTAGEGKPGYASNDAAPGRTTKPAGDDGSNMPGVLTLLTGTGVALAVLAGAFVVLHRRN